MKATISYRVRTAFVPGPDGGGYKWALTKVLTTDLGSVVSDDPVAMFDTTMEAQTFQEHVFAEGLDGKLVEVDADMRELFERQAAHRG